jgi:plastocyanin
MGGSMMGAASGPATAKLTIQHVQKGCHVWSNGKTTAAMMRLHLKVGQKLSILDMDVDAHQMVQFSGPARMGMGGPMMMNRSVTLMFSKKGVYRLGTKTVPMPGAMEVKTIGPDNNLRLVVTVA